MSLEILAFFTSALCAMLLVGIEGYHILNIKNYTGTVLPVVMGILDKAYKDAPEDEASQMDPAEIV
jgi:hypothetical protein